MRRLRAKLFDWVGKGAALCALTGLAACTGAHYAADRANPAMYPSGSGFRTSSPAKITDPSLETPQSQAGRYAGNQDEAVTSLMVSALSLATNPDYYREDFVTGRCLCRFAPDGVFELPCANVTVVLVSDKGREVSRIFSSDGEFVFAVERGLSYSLKIESNRYSVLSAPAAIHSGEDVALHLGKRARADLPGPVVQ